MLGHLASNSNEQISPKQFLQNLPYPSPFQPAIRSQALKEDPGEREREKREWRGKREKQNKEGLEEERERCLIDLTTLY